MDYGCNAENHTYCNEEYCDFAYERMLMDDGSVQFPSFMYPFDNGIEQEYDYSVVSEDENLYEG